MADVVLALELEYLCKGLNDRTFEKFHRLFHNISSEIRCLELQSQRTNAMAMKKQVVRQIPNNYPYTYGGEFEFQEVMQDNQAIFKIQSEVVAIFRQFLLSEGFIELYPPLYAPLSEGGGAAFESDYFGQSTCLAQSPQFHKQMAICAGFGRVFMSEDVSIADDSNTHSHLFSSLHVEMEMDEPDELMDTVERLFITIFDILNKNCKKELEAVGKKYPFTQLKYLSKTLRLSFEEGVQMLKDAGVQIGPAEYLHTEAKRKLGQLVLEKYDTEFYILHGFPLALRPFYTMPCEDKPGYGNSFDVFVRGEEIITGGEHINNVHLLTDRAEACGIDLETITTYLDPFGFGVRPHGGFCAELNNFVMIFLGLNSIGKTSLLTCDPHGLN